MAGEKKIRILITKIGLDGHDLGAKLIAKMLSDGGMEVIYLGKFQTAEAIVNAAISEDVDIIGISVLSPNHIVLIPKVIKLLKEKNMKNIKIVIGGIVPEPFASELTSNGISKIFGHHTTSDELISYIKKIAF